MRGGTAASMRRSVAAGPASMAQHRSPPVPSRRTLGHVAGRGGGSGRAQDGAGRWVGEAVAGRGARLAVVGRSLGLAVAGGAVIVGLVVGPAGPAEATWSLVGVDQATNEVGVAIASCVPADILGDPEQPLVPVVLQPGVVAAVAQGQLNLDAPDLVADLVAAGADADEIVGELSDETGDELAPLRQYAVASLSGQVAAFTGDANGADALDAQGPNVSVQGNLLASDNVVTESLDGFRNRRLEGGTLAQGLVAGLAAGAAAGGDRRCDDQRALFAQVAVAGPDDDPLTPDILLTVLVDPGDGQDPVALLASAFDDGQRGVIDATRTEPGPGRYVLIGGLTAAALMLLGGVIALRRGIGSVRARR